MAVTWNGNSVPSETDPWALVADMGKMAALNNRVIPVYSKAERDALAVTAPAGVVPDGTVVLRLDQVQYGAVMDVFTGGVWVDGFTEWINVTLNAGFAVQSRFQYARLNGIYMFRGGVSSTGLTTESNFNVGFIPSSSAPGTFNYWTVATDSANHQGRGELRADGQIWLRTGSSVRAYYMYDVARWGLG